MTVQDLSRRTRTTLNGGALMALGRRAWNQLVDRQWREVPLSLTRRLVSPLPDRAYLTLGHFAYFGRWPNYENPRTFNEHIQEYMLRCRDPLLRVAADKIRCREYIASRVGAKYLVPLLGVWDDPESVPLDTLPRPCVLKQSAGSGMVLILRTGDNRPAEELRPILRGWLKRDYYKVHREWCYSGLPRRILAEVMVSNRGSQQVPTDYKAYVIGGSVRYFHVDQGRFERHTRNLYGREWELLPVRWTLERHRPEPAPTRLKEMIEVAEVIARPFEFLRVDCYEIDGKLYVGELTNYPGAGFEKFIPGAYANVVGAYWTRRSTGTGP
jgi:hypothetical protein